jgi:hypothetical protein
MADLSLIPETKQLPLERIDAILEERGKQYGKFTGHAEIAQNLKDTMRFSSPNCAKWARLANDQKEALDMIQHKIARILNGNPDHADSWDDIAGYAKLVGDRLKGTSK